MTVTPGKRKSSCVPAGFVATRTRAVDGALQERGRLRAEPDDLPGVTGQAERARAPRDTSAGMARRAATPLPMPPPVRARSHVAPPPQKPGQPEHDQDRQEQQVVAVRQRLQQPRAAADAPASGAGDRRVGVHGEQARAASTARSAPAGATAGRRGYGAKANAMPATTGRRRSGQP